MKLSDVPKHPAYLVFHDAFDRGAMDVYPYTSYSKAQEQASTRNLLMTNEGAEEAGHWAAYIKLPRVRVWRFHAGNGVTIR